MSKSKAELERIEQERQTAISQLRSLIHPGSVVYTITSYVRQSRNVRVFVAKDSLIREITSLVATATGNRESKTGQGINIGGYGFNAGFHVVYSLGRTLFPEGFNCPGAMTCRSCDHFNGDQDYSPTHPHGDGGYALSHIEL